MPTRMLQIEIKGELYKTIVFIGGIEIKLWEMKEHNYKRHFSRFTIDGLLDVMFHLEGIQGTEWKVLLKWEDETVWQKEGIIGPQGYTELKELLKIN